MIIRKAEIRDAEVITGFIKELAEYENLLDQVKATTELITEQIFEQKNAEVLICEDDGKAVGYALYFINFSTFLARAGIYIEDLYIQKSCRGKGFGKAMLKKISEIAREKGCGRVEWSCLDWNKSSIDFYISLGAKPMDGWTVYRLEGNEINRLADK